MLYIYSAPINIDAKKTRRIVITIKSKYLECLSKQKQPPPKAEVAVKIYINIALKLHH